jgi:tetratricopeptide (TPR) repeat protein
MRLLSALQHLLRRPRRLLAVLALLVLIGAGAAVAGIHLRAEYHFRAAKSALESHHPSVALEHLQVCLHTWPSNGPTHLLAARAARLSGDLERADHHLKEYERCCGRSSDDESNLERALLRAQRGEMDEVLPYCRSLIESDHPDRALILEALTIGYLSNYRVGEATLSLKVWLEREPENPRALLLRGSLNEARENPDGAAVDYARVVELAPDHHEARLRLTGLLLDSNQAATAFKHLESLKQHLPDHPLVRVRLALCRYQMGYPAEAEKLLDDVLERHPRFPPALTSRGLLALHAGQPAAAEKWLQQSVVLARGDQQAYHYLQRALNQLGRKAEAKEAEDRRKALEADTRRLATIVTRELTTSPHKASLHCEIGLILMRGDQIVEGVRWLKSALKEDPHYKEAHEALADYYTRIGHLSGAARHRELAKQGDQATK